MVSSESKSKERKHPSFVGDSTIFDILQDFECLMQVRRIQEKEKDRLATNKEIRMVQDTLSKRINNEMFKNECQKFGETDYAYVIYEPGGSHSQKISRGYAFVRFKLVEDANACKESLSGKELYGQKCEVQYSKNDRPREKTPGQYLGHKRRSPPRRRSPSHSRSRSRSEGYRRSRDRYYRDERDRYQRPRRDRSRDRYYHGGSSEERDRRDRDRERDRYAGRDRRFKDRSASPQRRRRSRSRSTGRR